MPRIARLLTAAETDAVAAYFAALPPPSPAQTVAATPGRTAPTIVSGPTRGGAPGSVQGSGTEQGAPLSGGTQGVGGPGNPNGPPSGAPGAARAHRDAELRHTPACLQWRLQ